MKKWLTMTVLVTVIGLTTTAMKRGDAEHVRVMLADAELHLALKESSPKKDELLSASPENITLWFTQAPQMAGTSVRLLPKGGEPMELGDAVVAEDDDTVVILGVTHELTDGEYEVHWRAMAQDGHVIRGDFGFMVHATR